MHTNDGRWRQSCFIFFGMLLLLLLRQWSFIHILHPHPSNRILFSITLRSLGSSLPKLRIFERARASLVVRGRAFDLLFFRFQIFCLRASRSSAPQKVGYEIRSRALRDYSPSWRITTPSHRGLAQTDLFLTIWNPDWSSFQIPTVIIICSRFF